MNYTIDHIKAAFRAAKKGLSEAGFLNYLEFHSLLAEDAPTVKHVPKTRAAGKVKAVKTVKPAKKVKRAKRGKLGESILKFLSTKGKEGAHAKDIAAAVGSKVPNVTAWFYSTGKKTTKKLGGNKFAVVPKG
jgi:hypothetical protein